MSTQLAKPVRVIRELTNEELKLRKLERIEASRKATIARVNADALERMQEVFLGPQEPTTNGAPPSPEVFGPETAS
jgi:hypothetical protein